MTVTIATECRRRLLPASRDAATVRRRILVATECSCGSGSEGSNTPALKFPQVAALRPNVYGQRGRKRRLQHVPSYKNQSRLRKSTYPEPVKYTDDMFALMIIVQQVMTGLKAVSNWCAFIIRVVYWLIIRKYGPALVERVAQLHFWKNRNISTPQKEVTKNSSASLYIKIWARYEDTTGRLREPAEMQLIPVPVNTDPLYKDGSPRGIYRRRCKSRSR
jgi:hypothetical protein